MTEYGPLPYRFSVMGTPIDATFKAILTDTAQSIRALAETAGITWVVNGQSPHAALVSIETNNARTGTVAINAAGTLGHVVASGISYWVSGAAWVNATCFCNAAAGVGAVIQISLGR